MKKHFLRFVCFLFLTVLATGCGEKAGRYDILEKIDPKPISREEAEEILRERAEKNPSPTPISEPETDENSNDDNTGNIYINHEIMRTLEQHYSKPEILELTNTQIAELAKSLFPLYADISWEAKDNTFIYRYVFNSKLSDKEIKLFKSSVEAPLEAACTMLIPVLEAESGAKDVAIRYVYYNGNYDVIYDHTFKAPKQNTEPHAADKEHDINAENPKVSSAPSPTAPPSLTQKPTSTPKPTPTPTPTVVAASALEAYYAQPEVKNIMDAEVLSVQKTASAIYSDISWSVSGDTVSYIYTYNAGYINEDNFEELAAAATLLEPMVNNIVANIRKSSGVKDAKLQYVYCDADHSILYSHIYE